MIKLYDQLQFPIPPHQASNAFCPRMMGMWRWHSKIIKSSPMLRCSQAYQYHLHNSLSWLQWLQKPWRINCLSCWYSWSWSAWCLRSFSCVLPRFMSVMARIWVIDISGWLWMSNSASVSLLVESLMGFRDKGSGRFVVVVTFHPLGSKVEGH